MKTMITMMITTMKVITVIRKRFACNILNILFRKREGTEVKLRKFEHINVEDISNRGKKKNPQSRACQRS